MDPNGLGSEVVTLNTDPLKSLSSTHSSILPKQLSGPELSQLHHAFAHSSIFGKQSSKDQEGEGQAQERDNPQRMVHNLFENPNGDPCFQLLQGYSAPAKSLPEPPMVPFSVPVYPVQQPSRKNDLPFQGVGDPDEGYENAGTVDAVLGEASLGFSVQSPPELGTENLHGRIGFERSHSSSASEYLAGLEYTSGDKRDSLDNERNITERSVHINVDIRHVLHEAHNRNPRLHGQGDSSTAMGVGDTIFTSAEFKRIYKDLIRQHQPNVVVLTETRVSGQKAHQIVSNLGFPKFHTFEPMGYLGGGDFNEILSPDEKWGVRDASLSRIKDFQDCLDACGLTDMGFSGPKYTWYNKRPNGQIVFERSDHNPMLLRSRPSQGNRNAQPFRCERIWINHLDFLNVLQEAWGTIGNLSSKLGVLKNKAIEWNKVSLGNIFQKKKTLIRRLNSTGTAINSRPSPQLALLEQELSNQYREVLLTEEELWASKARIDWLQLGDGNSKFFLTSVISRRRQNRILGLKNNVGEWIHDPVEIKSLIVSYFVDCFSPSQVFYIPSHICHPNAHLALSGIDCNIPNLEEVKSALWDLKPFKSARVDGFQPGFFQKYWDIVDTSISNKIQEVKEPVIVNWQTPPKGWWKINIDGSCFTPSDDIVAGGVIRDHCGNWILGFSKYIGVGSILCAELWSVLFGLELARRAEGVNIIVESDSLVAINLINDLNMPSSHHYFPLISRYRSFLALFNEVRFTHKFREVNQVADTLAKYGVQSKCDLTCFRMAPPFLAHVFWRDYFGHSFIRGSSSVVIDAG
ncbi:reverse transcriptase [Senna tora]|uniref:Reverse transcriptase n=1 Tax=Senna tora TaxID=362788 RepID=A0A834W3U8_9FABA|nr:reverse transcriptase [Senna tora]